VKETGRFSEEKLRKRLLRLVPTTHGPKEQKFFGAFLQKSAAFPESL
jgi:hypothetical protein